MVWTWGSKENIEGEPNPSKAERTAVVTPGSCRETCDRSGRDRDNMVETALYCTLLMADGWSFRSM
jgi:hypothetical protein